MFSIFRFDPPDNFVDETPLSKFIGEAPSSKKKQVYKRVIEKATAAQTKLMHDAHEAMKHADQKLKG